MLVMLVLAAALAAVSLPTAGRAATATCFALGGLAGLAFGSATALAGSLLLVPALCVALAVTASLAWIAARN